jgi:hypothetical protein
MHSGSATRIQKTKKKKKEKFNRILSVKFELYIWHLLSFVDTKECAYKIKAHQNIEQHMTINEHSA